MKHLYENQLLNALAELDFEITPNPKPISNTWLRELLDEKTVERINAEVDRRVDRWEDELLLPDPEHELDDDEFSNGEDLEYWNAVLAVYRRMCSAPPPEWAKHKIAFNDPFRWVFRLSKGQKISRALKDQQADLTHMFDDLTPLQKAKFVDGWQIGGDIPQMMQAFYYIVPYWRGIPTVKEMRKINEQLDETRQAEQIAQQRKALNQALTAFRASKKPSVKRAPGGYKVGKTEK